MWLSSLGNLGASVACILARELLTMQHLKSIRIHQPGKEFLDAMFSTTSDKLWSWSESQVHALLVCIERHGRGRRGMGEVEKEKETKGAE